MHDIDPKWKEVKRRLDSVSPSFCMAKWKHATVHLLNGRTHSCYLPPTHSVPLKEIERSPSALHNTQHKKEQRRKMLSGERPAECSMCWAIEDLPEARLSDRIIRGQESWTLPYFDETKNAAWDADVYPSYLEVSFSSLCNFRCSYCSPHVSSAWLDEVKRSGPYQLADNYRHQDLDWMRREGMLPLDENDNPYIDAFWKWWPDLYPNLRVFRVTGGEPLLSKHTFRVLDWVENNPHPNLELDVNTNLGAPQAVMQRFLEQAKRIVDAGHVKRFRIHTSLDTWGPQAEYIRNGLRFDYFWRNVEQFLAAIPTGEVFFMSTFNALSVVGYRGFLQGLLDLRKKFGQSGRSILADIPHLTQPEFLNVRVLTPDYLDRMDAHIEFMEKNASADGFQPFEVEKMRRVRAWMRVEQDEAEVNRQRRNFYLYFREHDRRRGTNFLSTFPEMEAFWQFCESLN